MTLFSSGEFHLHSGNISTFKIDCDHLADEDIRTLAKIISQRMSFGRVVGIPTGGDRLAKELEKYSNTYYNPMILIVDDVLTTGSSMEEVRNKYPRPFVKGVVIFSRGECPDWITPIFQISKELYDI